MERENALERMPVDRKPGWSFYIAWVILTSVCMPAAFVISLFFDRIVTDLVGDYIYVNGVPHITEDYLALYFLVPITALLTGAVQYGILRRVLPRLGWWVPATLGGWLLGILLTGIAIPLQWMEPININPTFLLLGLSIGFSQWLVLRRRLSAAGWWIVANLLGWALLALVTGGNSFDQFGLFIVGFFPACTTAAVLAFLRKPVQLV